MLVKKLGELMNIKKMLEAKERAREFISAVEKIEAIYPHMKTGFFYGSDSTRTVKKSSDDLVEALEHIKLEIEVPE